MKRQELIDAALLHYSLHGYQGATMRKIASEVGIKPASIYFFYENKEALFIAAFEQLLLNHFDEMNRILLENEDATVDKIFSAMLKGIVSHHTGDLQATTAYISLVTSPIPEIKADLQKHMLKYTDWLVDSLEALLKRDFPLIPSEEVNRVIKQFVLIGNGVFWGINLYKGKDFEEQVALADQMIQSIFDVLKSEYS
ncbi:TetR/AcrR family transcriptional regulator [Sporosarcina jiandibaonis]|uniref:TetR/AcrR family transcriptional regulator n=1 Tax=Sporosarcina jiandibaonis TaxID=2715535 RepID=UPI0015533C3B|nr:TetR/AcrR family transcriptional regulator [Sporosarcina jiandibaonis]